MARTPIPADPCVPPIGPAGYLAHAEWMERHYKAGYRQHRCLDCFRSVWDDDEAGHRFRKCTLLPEGE